MACRPARLGIAALLLRLAAGCSYEFRHPTGCMTEACSFFGSAMANESHISIQMAAMGMSGRWTAVGFNTAPQMSGADILAAKVDASGEVTVHDMKATGYYPPASDTIHNTGLSSFSLTGGNLSVSIVRPLDTGDVEQDLNLKQQCVHVLFVHVPGLYEGGEMSGHGTSPNELPHRSPQPICFNQCPPPPPGGGGGGEEEECVGGLVAHNACFRKTPDMVAGNMEAITDACAAQGQVPAIVKKAKLIRDLYNFFETRLWIGLAKEAGAMEWTWRDGDGGQEAFVQEHLWKEMEPQQVNSQATLDADGKLSTNDVGFAALCMDRNDVGYFVALAEHKGHMKSGGTTHYVSHSLECADLCQEDEQCEAYSASDYECIIHPSGNSASLVANAEFNFFTHAD